MATKTTTKVGSYSDPTCWSPSGVPASGDSLVINHAHTFDSSFSGIGTTAFNANVTTSGTGLTFGWAANAAIAVANAATVSIGAGNALAGVTGSQAVWTIGVYNPTTHPSLQLNGTSGSHVAVSDHRFSGNRFSGNSGDGIVKATYTDFLRCGDATNAMMSPNELGFSNPFTLYDCIFDACGGIVSPSAIPGGDTWDIRRCSWKNTASGVVPLYVLCSAARTTGVRNLIDCYFDATPQFFSFRDWTVTGTTFAANYSATTGRPAAWSNVIGRKTVAATATFVLFGDVVDCYWLVDVAPGSAEDSNVHFVTPDASTTGTMLVDGSIYHHAGNADDGDCLAGIGPTAATTYTQRRNIILGNATGGSSGTLFTLGGNANTTLACEHNTCLAGPQAAAYGESSAGHIGMISSFRGNLAWNGSVVGGGSGGFKLWDSGHLGTGTGIVADVVAPSVADYNGGFNMNDHYTTGAQAWLTNQGNGYVGAFSSTPGTHDVNGQNPAFVAPTRNIATWDASLGGLGTIAHALLQLQARASGYTVPALIAYVRAGFAPTAPAYHNASYSGDPISADIGAVPWVSSATLAAGTASFVSSGPAGISLSATEATAGVPPYTHRWQRAAHGGGFTDLADGPSVSGSTTLALTDGSAVAGNLYDYRILYTDAASSTATSAAVPSGGAGVYTGGPIGGGGTGTVVFPARTDFGGGY